MAPKYNVFCNLKTRSGFFLYTVTGRRVVSISFYFRYPTGTDGVTTVNYYSKEKLFSFLYPEPTPTGRKIKLPVHGAARRNLRFGYPPPSPPRVEPSGVPPLFFLR